MKFDTTKTKGGHKILSLHGPDEDGCCAGVVEVGDSFLAVAWHSDGEAMDNTHYDYDLIPLADEPKPEPSDTTELWNYVHSSSKEISALREVIADTLKRMDGMRQDYIARVNGLRADYLADKDAVSPARVDELEDLVKDAHETAAFANRKVVAWTDRVEALEERLEALEQDKVVDKFLLGNSGLMDKLAKQEEFNKSTQPSDVGAGVETLPTSEQKVLTEDAGQTKGVWVTREKLKDLYLDTFNFESLAHRLGLEE